MSANSLDEKPMYFIATGDDGLWSSLCAESNLKQAVHDTMCVCKQPWEQCESEGVPDTVRLLDDADEWSGHDPFPRFSWGQDFEDGYIRVTLLTDRAALAPHLPVELPELDVTEDDMERGLDEAHSTPGCLIKTQGDCNFAARLACRERQLLEYVAEVARLRTCGMIELMLANPNADSFVREKERELATSKAERLASAERLDSHLTPEREDGKAGI